jgi:hypothetical protein
VTFDTTVWIFLSVPCVICLVGVLLLYRKLSTIHGQLLRLNDDGITSSASLKAIPPLMKGLQQALTDVNKDSREIQRSTSDALGKIADNALNSWSTFEKAISFLTEDARNVATTIEKGNEALAETVQGYDQVLKSLKSNDEFLESQAISLRSAGIAMRDSVQEVSSAVISVQGSLAAGFEGIRARAINDQLAAYPRKLLVEPGEREIDLDPVEQRSGLWLMRGRSERVRFRLVCESDKCQNRKGLYESDFVYELREPARLSFTYLPSEGDVEAFFDIADISGITDHLEKAAGACLAVTLGLPISAVAHSVFVVATIALDAGIEDLVKKLQADFRDREATKELWALVVKSSPYQIKDVGGPGHTQFGEFIRHKEESDARHLYKRFGGLSKWMDPDKQTFAWVCPTDAYNLIAKYRSDSERPARSGNSAA